MKRTTIIAAAVIVVLGIGFMLGLNRYKLVLIQTIVENAVIQKAPAGHSQEQIRRAFDEHYRKAGQMDREDEYLDRLLKASQRLEKIQHLESDEVDQLLMHLDPERGSRPDAR